MALFGVQFVLSVAMATILQKISPFISLGKWILCNEHLVRYLHPSDEELRSLIGKNAVSSNKGKVRKGAASDSRKRQSNAAAAVNNIDDVKTFTVPCNVDVHLTKATIEEIDLLPQFLYHDYKWLIDFSFCAAVINVLVEILAYLFPEIYTQELNLGLVWNCLVIFFAMYPLYFRPTCRSTVQCVTGCSGDILTSCPCCLSCLREQVLFIFTLSLVAPSVGSRFFPTDTSRLLNIIV